MTSEFVRQCYYALIASGKELKEAATLAFAAADLFEEEERNRRPTRPEPRDSARQIAARAKARSDGTKL
jgi:hypothetical protein